MTKLPSNYCSHPLSSILQKTEPECVARNIMIILKRTGNVWRELSEQEYQLEREKDAATDNRGGYSSFELYWFRKVIEHCTSSDRADVFCKNWYRDTTDPVEKQTIPIEQGRDAWFINKKISDNPYSENTSEYKMWEKGYKDEEWKYNYQTGG